MSRKPSFRKSNLADSSQSALHLALCRHACIKVQLEGSAVNTAAEYLHRRTCRLCVFLFQPSQTHLSAAHIQPSATTLDDSARRSKSSLFSWWRRTGLKLSYSSSFSRQKNAPASSAVSERPTNRRWCRSLEDFHYRLPPSRPECCDSPRSEGLWGSSLETLRVCLRLF